MAKTITLRLDSDTYQLFQTFAYADNRPISNFIETAAKKHLEECLFVDELEMESVRRDKRLIEKLKLGSQAAKRKKGRFAKPIANE